ncbi:MAG: hypothetical protein A6D92_04760 [Symbiobacterium thermophilum]|uniref:asparagine synthase (glutamine-hydrolyzing) n=1 Tax=Symbiobacterium thermophilum TaxID=2734 RepID=A0A1Y2T7E6_SYMTR|nr:MAG: hypothetical protein A6D92_04760 [Symbiobacterium thermophilum]
MCGIAGWVDWKRDLSREAPVVEAMIAPLADRGPDAGGIWCSGHCAFGHRRLAVVDLVGGAQPMVRSRGDRTYVLVYNGQLYNTQELRESSSPAVMLSRRSRTPRSCSSRTWSGGRSAPAV